MGFEKLEEIITLNVEYTTKSALAISAGEQPAEIVESPVVKLGGQPVIPGSSLKGAIRSTLEGMLAKLGEHVCIPFAAIPRPLRGKVDQERYAMSLGRIPPCSDVKNPCPVCSIFGTVGGQAGLSGKAIVLDAKVEEGSYELIERTHVAITRDTKSQAEGSLMSLQAVDAGATFRGAIRLINPEPWQVGAVARALEAISFLGMGAKKTAGYGELEIRITGVDKTFFDSGSWLRQTVALDLFLDAFSQRYRQ